MVAIGTRVRFSAPGIKRIVRQGADRVQARTIRGTVVFVERRATDFPIVVLWDNRHLTVENSRTLLRG